MQPNRKKPETEIEGTTVQPIVNPTPKKNTFPWKIIFILAIGAPATVIGILAIAYMFLLLIFGGMDCGGTVPDQRPSAAKPVAPKPIAPKPVTPK